MFEVNAEDDTFKILVELTRNVVRNLITMLSVEINVLEHLKGTEADKNNLACDAWASRETINVSRNTAQQHTEKVTPYVFCM